MPEPYSKGLDHPISLFLWLGRLERETSKQTRKPMSSPLLPDSKIKDALHAIVSSLTNNTALREDLMQDALLHLWQVQLQKPHRTRSWYLQSCRFQLGHRLAAGRSVDSLKRSAGDNRLIADETNLPDHHT